MGWDVGVGGLCEGLGQTSGLEPGLGQRFLVLGHGFRARISWSALGLGYGSDFVVRLRVKRLVVGARFAGIGNANLAITIITIRAQLPP